MDFLLSKILGVLPWHMAHRFTQFQFMYNLGLIIDINGAAVPFCVLEIVRNEEIQ